MEQLRMRYEFPNDKNRWENPLYHVQWLTESGPQQQPRQGVGTATESAVGEPTTVFTDMQQTLSKGPEAPVAAAALAASAAAPKKSSWKPKGSKKNAITSTAAPEDGLAPAAAAVPTATDSAVWFSGSHVRKPTIAGGTGAVDTSAAAVVAQVINFVFCSSSELTGGSASSSGGGGMGSIHPSPAGQAPNASTTSVPHAQANILYELDRVSALVTSKIIAHVKLHPVDSSFSFTDVAPPLLFPEYDRAFNIHRQITVAELHRHRRQFVKVNTLCPPVVHTTDGLSNNESLCASLGCMYIDFLSAQL
jgi:hypothetical protein